MQASLEQVFLNYSADKLLQLAARIATCLDMLSEEQIWMRESETQNAIGNLVLHLCGNLRQGIGHGVGGQSDVRMRDSEFTARGGITTTELRQCLETAATDAAAIIRQTTPERLAELVAVQGYQLTVLEAILHVVEHFSSHAVQIIFATKLFTGEDLGFYRHLTNPAARGETIP